MIKNLVFFKPVALQNFLKTLFFFCFALPKFFFRVNKFDPENVFDPEHVCSGKGLGKGRQKLRFLAFFTVSNFGNVLK